MLHHTVQHRLCYGFTLLFKINECEQLISVHEHDGSKNLSDFYKEKGGT